jgi:hypothetical protein
VGTLLVHELAAADRKQPPQGRISLLGHRRQADVDGGRETLLQLRFRVLAPGKTAIQ